MDYNSPAPHICQSHSKCMPNIFSSKIPKVMPKIESFNCLRYFSNQMNVILSCYMQFDNNQWLLYYLEFEEMSYNVNLLWLQKKNVEFSLHFSPFFVFIIYFLHVCLILLNQFKQLILWGLYNILSKGHHTSEEVDWMLQQGMEIACLQPFWLNSCF